jgi:predicted GNAT family N-acyltransferase
MGTVLVQNVIENLRARGATHLLLNAHPEARPFYEKLGFRGEGEEFDEAGILHVRMRHVLE